MALQSLAISLTLCAIAFAACSGGSSRDVTGVVISVDAPTLVQLNSFTLRSDGGETLVFRPGPECSRDPQNGCVGSHLRSHLALGTKVQITYRKEGSDLLALKIVDIL